MPHAEVYYVSVRSFVRSSLFVLINLLFLALPQWMLLPIIAKKEHLMFTLICFCGSFLLLTVIHMSDTLKYEWPWNWLAIGSCYELMTLGLGTFLMDTQLQFVTIGLLICGFVWVLCFFIIGGFNYPNPYNLAVSAMIGLILVICILAVGTVYYWQFWVDLALVLFALSVLLLLISHVLISFNNLDVLVSADALLVGFVLYMNYVLVLVASFICLQRISNSFDTWARLKSNQNTAKASLSL